MTDFSEKSVISRQLSTSINFSCKFSLHILLCSLNLLFREHVETSGFSLSLDFGNYFGLISVVNYPSDHSASALLSVYNKKNKDTHCTHLWHGPEPPKYPLSVLAGHLASGFVLFQLGELTCILVQMFNPHFQRMVILALLCKKH